MTEQELHEKIINIIKENGVYNGKVCIEIIML